MIDLEDYAFGQRRGSESVQNLLPMMYQRLTRFLLLVAVLLASAEIGTGAALESAKPEAPFGIPMRVPWTTSKVMGSPEPPLPFQTMRVYEKLKFEKPLDITFTLDGNRALVLEQGGKLFSFPTDKEFEKADLVIDLAKVPSIAKLPDAKSTVSAYGVALHPHFASNHFCYLSYVPDWKNGGRNHEKFSRVSRFTVSDQESFKIDPGSEVILYEWLGGGHNGACLKFGPDGFLYISTGDGGDPDPPDPFFAGQDLSSDLSKILRIDVDHANSVKPYSIPPGNPFVKINGARPEIFAYGFRNPWRMNFDRQTGLLWVGDVGWELWESVICAKTGTNGGWSIMEGPNPVHTDIQPGPSPVTPPAAAISHSEGASITGGVVYHGKSLPDLAGYYIFGDWQTRQIWAAKCKGDSLEPYRTIAETSQRIVAFGEQPNGEFLIVDHEGGGLWKLIPNHIVANQQHEFPRKLSETGLFKSVKDQVPQTGVVPYTINAPQWLDGATADHWIAVPGTESIGWGKGVWGGDVFGWPTNSVLVRTLSIETRPGDPTSRRHIETQIMHRDERQWRGYSYAWNDEQTDATLVTAAGDDTRINISDPAYPGGIRKQPWHFSSRAQCMTCHNPWNDYLGSFNIPQFDRTVKFGEVTDNQVRAFRHVGLFAPPAPKPPSEAELKALTNPYDNTATLQERARSYLHVNCSECHRFGGGGSALFDVRKELPDKDTHLIDVKPSLGQFGIEGGRLIASADPARSILLFRMGKLGRGRMPHIGSDCVDEKGFELIRQWISQLPDPKVPPEPAADAARKDHDAMLKILEDGNASTETINSAADHLGLTLNGAMAVLCDMSNGKLPPATAKLIALKASTSSQEPIRDLFRRFNPELQNVERLGANFNIPKLLAMEGDANRGRNLFVGQASAGLCSKCHKLGNDGIDFGPDLSHIATKYDRAALLDNIINPSKSIAEGFATHVVRTNGNDIFSGMLLKQTADEIVLKDAQAQPVHIPQTEVKQHRTEAMSAMPEGLLGDLQPQQAADLLAFLMTLK